MRRSTSCGSGRLCCYRALALLNALGSFPTDGGLSPAWCISLTETAGSKLERITDHPYRCRKTTPGRRNLAAECRLLSPSTPMRIDRPRPRSRTCRRKERHCRKFEMWTSSGCSSNPERALHRLIAQPRRRPWRAVSWTWRISLTHSSKAWPGCCTAVGQCFIAFRRLAARAGRASQTGRGTVSERLGVSQTASSQRNVDVARTNERCARTFRASYASKERKQLDMARARKKSGAHLKR